VSLGKVVATDRSALDLRDNDAIRQTIRATLPDLIVNAAAYTRVDAAEAEPELAMQVNADAPRILAEEAARANAALVHYSTDYVFSGALSRPYREDDPPDPINAYGRSKLAGERAIASSGAAYLILRTSWVFGPGGKNFFSTVLELAREREELRIVDDQIGKPNWSRMVADASVKILLRWSSPSGRIADAMRDAGGIYQLCGPDHVSRFGFAQEILALYARYASERHLAPLRVKRIIPQRSAEFPASAPRPLNSLLSAEKLARAFAISLPSWREQLEMAFEDLLNGLTR